MKKYVFKPYLLIFPKLFEEEKKRILSHVKQKVRIEHVGSTAVPHLGGKGIIDLALAVEKKEMEALIHPLHGLGYEFKPNFSTDDRLYFVADLPDQEEGVRRYHLHVTYAESPEWIDLIFFRDYLRTHPQEAKNYAELKERAAQEVNQDGEKYRQLKEPYFKKILKRD